MPLSDTKLDTREWESLLNRRHGVLAITSGVFDLFHDGHRRFLKSCMDLCDSLICGVDTDARVQCRKGPSRPVDNWKTRSRNVIRFHESIIVYKKSVSIDHVIRLINPNVYVTTKQAKVSDDRKSLLDELHVKCVVLPYHEEVSTTLLIQHSCSTGIRARRRWP